MKEAKNAYPRAPVDNTKTRGFRSCGKVTAYTICKTKSSNQRMNNRSTFTGPETSPIEIKQSRVSRATTATSQRRNHPSCLKENKMTNQVGTRGSITAKSWIVFDPINKKVIAEKNSFSKMQMASVTKIMILITTLDLIQALSIDPKRLLLIIPKRAQLTRGTSARLKEGNLLSFQDMMYGLMLPSGNDAAITLALYMGTLTNCKGSDGDIYDPKWLHTRMMGDPLNLGAFLTQMNNKSQLLCMNETHYSNPHGLNNKNNYSTCRDLALLCSYAMDNQKFASIVSTRQYKAECLATTQKYFWENTNKLIGQGWKGIKTGVTPAAGPCLASYWQGWVHKKNCSLIVILLNCDSLQARFKETRLLKNKYLFQLQDSE